MQDLALAPQSSKMLTQIPVATSPYERAKAADLAEHAKAIKITARTPKQKTGGLSAGRIGHCIWCVNVATMELLFHYQAQFRGEESFAWIIVEKYCDQCARARFPEVVATSASEVKKIPVS